MSDFSQQDIARFWSHVDKERSNIFYNGERCWEWIASGDSSGYGQMKVNGVSTLVHRMSYELAVGGIPENIHVLHHCDNRPCVNPAHLFSGTNKDNVDDMIRKGRHADFGGEANPSRKLSDEEVEEIRKRSSLADGLENVSSLARFFGISRRQIRRIAIRKSWR
jgi:hypothetical protein